MRSLLGSLAVAASLFLLCSPAGAATVYDNGAPDTLEGYDATGWVQADDFKLGADATVTGATVYLFSMGPIAVPDASLSYFIFSDQAGQPGALLTSGAASQLSFTDTGLKDPWGSAIWAATFDFADAFQAMAGATYWFGIHATDDYVRQDIYFATAPSHGAPGQLSQGGTFDNWMTEGGTYAFSLSGAGGAGGVPEPAAWALMITGFGMAGVALRRRREAVLAA